MFKAIREKKFWLFILATNRMVRKIKRINPISSKLKHFSFIKLCALPICLVVGKKKKTTDHIT